MDHPGILPAPVLPEPAEDKWRIEQKAFHRLLPELLKCLPDQYVAIHQQKVVGNGSDKLEVAARAYAEFGYVPIFVSLVSDQPPVPIRLSPPRSLTPRKSP